LMVIVAPETKFVPVSVTGTVVAWPPELGLTEVKLGAGILLLTVTLSDVLVCMLFESVAIAIKLWLPFATAVESHVVEYGDAVSGALMLTPSTWNCTEDIVAGLVADAVAARVTDEPDTVAPLEGAVIEIAGGVPATPVL